LRENYVEICSMILAKTDTMHAWLLLAQKIDRRHKFMILVDGYVDSLRVERRSCGPLGCWEKYIHDV
jgi:hypothetical protein